MSSLTKKVKLSRWDRMSPEQKAGASKRSLEWTKRNRERAREKGREYYARNVNAERQRSKKKNAERKQRDPEKVKEIYRRWYEKRKVEKSFWMKRTIKNIRNRCAKSGVIFDLVDGDLEPLFPVDGKCPVLGTKFVFGRGVAQESPTIDRLRPGLGYIKSNIRIISRKANTIKQDVTDPEVFRRLASWMECELERAD